MKNSFVALLCGAVLFTLNVHSISESTLSPAVQKYLKVFDDLENCKKAPNWFQRDAKKNCKYYEEELYAILRALTSEELLQVEKALELKVKALKEENEALKKKRNLLLKKRN